MITRKKNLPADPTRHSVLAVRGQRNNPIEPESVELIGN